MTSASSRRSMLEIEYALDFKPMNDFPAKLVHHLVERFELSGKVVDIMCGRGEHATALESEGLETWLVDVSDAAAEIFPKRDERLHRADMRTDKIPYPDETFDVVWCKSAIEHVNGDHLMDEIYRVLKPGGKVLLLTNDWWYMWRVHWIDHTHGYGIPWMKQSMRSILYAYGFENVISENFHYLPFTWLPGWRGKLGRAFCAFIRLFPYPYNDDFTNPLWKIIRFSNEVALLGYGVKPSQENEQSK